MRALIVGHRADVSTMAVAAAMAARHGREAVRLVDLVELSKARWEHRVDSRGQAETRIDLRHGGASPFDVVFHRIDDFSGLEFRGWSAADRDYGRTEWLALLLSWLQGLGRRAVNRPSSGSLERHAGRPWNWLRVASSIGFATHPMGATTSTRAFPQDPSAVEHQAMAPDPWTTSAAIDRARGYAAPATATSDLVVVGERVFGEADALARENCLRLARAAQTDVLGVRLVRGTGARDWRFVGANAAPRIAQGEVLAALVALLEQRAAGS